MRVNIKGFALLTIIAVTSSHPAEPCLSPEPAQAPNRKTCLNMSLLQNNPPFLVKSINGTKIPANPAKPFVAPEVKNKKKTNFLLKVLTLLALVVAVSSRAAKPPSVQNPSKSPQGKKCGNLTPQEPFPNLPANIDNGTKLTARVVKTPEAKGVAKKTPPSQHHLLPKRADIEFKVGVDPTLVNLADGSKLIARGFNGRALVVIYGYTFAGFKSMQATGMGNDIPKKRALQ